MVRTYVLDSNDPRLRDRAYRKSLFREELRLILAIDNERRRIQNVDTAGTVSRIVELAYQLGMAHAETPGDDQRPYSSGEPAAIPWLTIPRVAREAWASVMLWEPDGRMDCRLSRWAPVSNPDRSFSPRTIAPLFRLGLLEQHGDTAQVTELGRRTWRAFKESEQ